MSVGYVIFCRLSVVSWRSTGVVLEKGDRQKDKSEDAVDYGTEAVSAVAFGL
jgi:hypothetical protein